MNTFLSKATLAIVVAMSFLLGGQWALAGNLPKWGGATTTTQPQPTQQPTQQPRQPLVSAPAPITAQTIQPTPPSSWTAPGSTSSPTGSTPMQQQPTYQPKPVYQPNTQFQTAPTPLRLQDPIGGPALGVSPPAQSPTGQPAPTESNRQDAPAKKARFRITLNGFKIFAQKGVLPRRGHSYYVAAKVLKYTQWGAILSHGTKTTKVIGHTNKFPGAIKGGTATNNGGFRNGDTYPGSIPYAASGAYNDRLPLLVWEGILEEGGDVVVVEPTIWEKRNGQDIFSVWYNQFPYQITDLLKCGPNEFVPTGVGYPVPQWTSQNPAPIDDLIFSEFRLAGKRVCVSITPRGIFRPLGRNMPDSIPGYTEKIFPDWPSMADPHGLLLNYGKAASIASENQTEPVVLVTYQQPSVDFDNPGGFPYGFIRANQRNSTVLPAGGIQPFWFGSQGNSGALHGQRIFIRTDKLSDMAGFFSAGLAHPIIPDSTAIELYLEIQQLPL